MRHIYAARIQYAPIVGVQTHFKAPQRTFFPGSNSRGGGPSEVLPKGRSILSNFFLKFFLIFI